MPKKNLCYCKCNYVLGLKYYNTLRRATEQLFFQLFHLFQAEKIKNRSLCPNIWPECIRVYRFKVEQFHLHTRPGHSPVCKI